MPGRNLIWATCLTHPCLFLLIWNWQDSLIGTITQQSWSPSLLEGVLGETTLVHYWWDYVVYMEKSLWQSFVAFRRTSTTHDDTKLTTKLKEKRGHYLLTDIISFAKLVHTSQFPVIWIMISLISSVTSNYQYIFQLIEIMGSFFHQKWNMCSLNFSNLFMLHRKSNLWIPSPKPFRSLSQSLTSILGLSTWGRLLTDIISSS